MTLQGTEDSGIWIAVLIASCHLFLQFIGSDSRNVCRHKRDRDSICPSDPGWNGGTKGKASIPATSSASLSSDRLPTVIQPVSSVIDDCPVSQPV